MPGNSVCRLTGRVRHHLNSVYLAINCQSNKIHTYYDLMAKRMHIQDSF